MSSSFPVIETPGSVTALDSHLQQHKDAIDELLQNAGAILFRGFHVPDSQSFDATVLAYGETNFSYAGSLSNAVRTNITERVFTANEAPPDVSIYLHHEMAQTPRYPSKLLFYCEIAPEEGGETPLCRSDLLLARLEADHPSLVREFEEKGVKYTNVMPGEADLSSGQGRSWRSTLNAETRQEAESRLEALGYSWLWQDGENLKATSPRLEAVRGLSSGRRVFFNQLIAAFRGWKDRRNDPSKSVTYGDGSAINPADMQFAIELADELTVDLRWQRQDVALVDNFLVMHGRRPFEGQRRVLATLVA